MNMGSNVSKEAIQNSDKLLKTKEVRAEKKKALTNLSEEIETHCPWLQEVRVINKKTWERIGRALRNSRVYGFTLRLWPLVMEIIEENEKQKEETESKWSLLSSDNADTDSSRDSDTETVEGQNTSSESRFARSRGAGIHTQHLLLP